MKKTILLILLTFALTFAVVFTGCGTKSDNTDIPTSETTQESTGGGMSDEPETGGDESNTENSGDSSESAPKPVQPIENGGNINKS